MRLQAVNFILIPFGAVTMAYFRRQLEFRPIFLSNLTANLTTFTVSVSCALSGLSYMSLAWSSLAGVVVTVAISLWFRPLTFQSGPDSKGSVKFFISGNSPAVFTSLANWVAERRR
jgi:O-antigen/teichoic acid export membrane protein